MMFTNQRGSHLPRGIPALIAGLLILGAGLCPAWGQAQAPPAVRSFPATTSAAGGVVPSVTGLGQQGGHLSDTSSAPQNVAPASPAKVPSDAGPTSGLRGPQNELTAPAPSAPQFATRHRHFSIPVSLVSGDPGIVGVNLFVSYNRGQSWERHSQIALSKGAFDFAAQQEGEFWFAVQTVATGGALHPERVTTPDLIVLVDQELPNIQASAQDDAAGRIQVTWSATDAHLDSRSLKIRYRPLPAGGEQWLEVPGEHPAGKALGPVYRDSLAFWPAGTETAFELAVTIADTAGNEATARTLCTRAQPKQMLVDARTAPPAGANALLTAQKPATPDMLATPVEWPSQVDFPSGQHVIENSTQGRLPAATASPGNTPNPNAGLSSNLPRSALPAAATLSPMSPSPPPASASELPHATPPPVDTLAATNASERRSILEPSQFLDQALPVGTTRFRLNYQVDSLALPDFQEVVIWVTRDQGATWDRLGETNNPTGPYAVSVDGSGLYGFRLVVSGRNGLKGRIPQPGDAADTWVLVDVDPPQVHLNGAPFGVGENAGKLIIQWQATDLRMELRPIDLEYSTSPDGPWATIEKNLRNTGSYAWAVDPNLQQRIYLRISARDTAGNRGSDQTTQAIDLANLFPRGRIQSVEPIRN